MKELTARGESHGSATVREVRFAPVQLRPEKLLV
jgi:hypothetical protein